MFYLNSTLNFGIMPVLVFQLEVYYKVDRLLTGLPAQQKGTTAQIKHLYHACISCLKSHLNFLFSCYVYAVIAISFDSGWHAATLSINIVNYAVPDDSLHV